jgi:hypothetical protein
MLQEWSYIFALHSHYTSNTCVFCKKDIKQVDLISALYSKTLYFYLSKLLYLSIQVEVVNCIIYRAYAAGAV